MIKLNITKTVPNPKYDEEYKEYKERSKYNYEVRELPMREFDVGVLSVEITDEQFEAIRKAVIDKF